MGLVKSVSKVESTTTTTQLTDWRTDRILFCTNCCCFVCQVLCCHFFMAPTPLAPHTQLFSTDVYCLCSLFCFILFCCCCCCCCCNGTALHCTALHCKVIKMLLLLVNNTGLFAFAFASLFHLAICNLRIAKRIRILPCRLSFVLCCDRRMYSVLLLLLLLM